ncbi:MAG: hypothetical protein WD689_07290 [Gaiellaceae bacterium]
MDHMLVEVLFMMVILKIPVVYICLVVWWAVRAEPRPLEGAVVPARLGALDEPCSWRRPRRPEPRGGRGRRTAAARAAAR